MDREYKPSTYVYDYNQNSEKMHSKPVRNSIYEGDSDAITGSDTERSTFTLDKLDNQMLENIRGLEGIELKLKLILTRLNQSIYLSDRMGDAIDELVDKEADQGYLRRAQSRVNDQCYTIKRLDEYAEIILQSLFDK